MKQVKVRFHLGKGVNYMKWQVKYPNGEIIYLPPDEHNLVLVNCKVRNQSKTAEAIFKGSNKTVCAWILCEQIAIFPYKPSLLPNSGREVSYNPRVTPNWDLEGKNVDNESFMIMYSKGKKLFI